MHRAPILELRIRRAVQRGARVVTVGAGATRLDTLRAARHISAAPGTAHAALIEAPGGGGELAGEVGERSLVIWNGRMSEPVAAVLAHLAHSHGCRVLPTPQAANELGCQAAGLAGARRSRRWRRWSRAASARSVLLGADPVGGWAGGERCAG